MTSPLPSILWPSRCELIKEILNLLDLTYFLGAYNQPQINRKKCSSTQLLNNQSLLVKVPNQKRKSTVSLCVALQCNSLNITFLYSTTFFSQFWDLGENLARIQAILQQTAISYHLNVRIRLTIVIIYLTRSIKAVDPDALRQQCWSEFQSDNTQRGAVPLHLPKMTYGKVAQTSSIPSESKDIRDSQMLTVSYLCKPRTYWSKEKMLHDDLRAQSDTFNWAALAGWGMNAGFFYFFSATYVNAPTVSNL